MLSSLCRQALFAPAFRGAVANASVVLGPVSCQSFLRFSTDGATDLQSRLSSMVKESDVVVFMKGVPEQPRCGFSNAVVQILRMHDVSFQAHDVLQDEEVRQGKEDVSL